jgi:ABC-type antimicrobial peptide transport system permease subunit
MKFTFADIIYSSLFHYRKQAFYQLIIVAILASVITGSLLTGYSVRESLRRSISTKLGKSDVIIISGLRYFNPSLAERYSRTSGLKSTSVTVGDGVCQNFSTGEKVLKAKFIGIGSDFFEFNGIGKQVIEEGTAAVNSSLAARLGLKKGDDIIITFSPVSDIPASSPFAASKGNTSHLVLKVSAIIPADSYGNFSLEVTQATPLNVFMNINDLFNDGEKVKANSVLLSNPEPLSDDKIAEHLRNSLVPDDIGLSARYIERSSESEVISSRVFLDKDIVDQISEAVPGAHPVITYLVNSISLKGRFTPYSFVAAISRNSFEEICSGNSIILNRWLADDIGASENDTVLLTWYNPGRISELEEKSEKFVVRSISEMSSIMSDSLLMPEFPGISGKESCSDWDAGVDIKMDRIRKEDEDYWNRFKGTPKAFISYQKGKEIWGSNFGPATAIRFDAPLTPEKILSGLDGTIDPLMSGFTIRNIREEMIKAAEESVDFSTLFLSLGFFIIAASVVLLVLAVKSWFDSRKKQLYSLFALGFRNSQIRQILVIETGIVALAGSIAGILSGLLLNFIMVSALNSVWRGAVQTDTITAFPGLMPVILGFSTTLFISLTVLFLFINRFLKRLTEPVTERSKTASPKLNLFLLFLSGFSAVIALTLFITGQSISTGLSFASGGLFFVFLILLWRQILFNAGISSRKFLSSSYYRYHPGRFIMPVLLIAAGLFAVVITGINRMHADEGSTDNKGGTGGYDLWAETTVPVNEELNSINGMKALGLEEFSGKFSVVQGKRTSGDDASCLNLNHVSSPPIIGINPTGFINNGSFSFASLLPGADREKPWEIITRREDCNVIFGFADQTVLDWGLKKKTGDTLVFRSESGGLLKLVIAGGLKASVFQGYIITDSKWISEFYPSVSGSSVFLIKCEDHIANSFNDAIRTRLEPYGVEILPAAERLKGFYEVTNTYLAVFTILGGFGIILGVAGLGFVLRFNYNLRKKEFALMLATGYTESAIRRIIYGEQIFTLFAGIATGLVSGIISTLPSITGGGGVEWISIAVIIAAMAVTGSISLSVAVRSLRDLSLTSALRRE